MTKSKRSKRLLPMVFSLLMLTSGCSTIYVPAKPLEITSAPAYKEPIPSIKYSDQYLNLLDELQSKPTGTLKAARSGPTTSPTGVERVAFTNSAG